MKTNNDDLLKIYDYARYCLVAHQVQYLKKLGTLKDMQHDIFVYVVHKKGITEFNNGTKRFIWVLAQYYPTYLRRYKYGSQYEYVPLDENNNSILDNIAISNTVEGDVSYDLSVYTDKKKAQQHSADWEFGWSKSKPVLVEFLNGDEKIFPSVRRAQEALGCGPNAMNRWLQKSANKEPLSKYFNKKSGPIKAVTYMPLNNPFAGSKMNIKRVMSETQWDAKEDKDDFVLDDYNEYYKLWKHLESGEGLLVRLKQPKEAFYINVAATK